MTKERISEIAKNQVSQMSSVLPGAIQELIEDGIIQAIEEMTDVSYTGDSLLCPYCAEPP